MFERVKHYYDIGLYSAANVMAFVDRGYLTMEQYNEILGIVPETEGDGTPEGEAGT